MRIFCSQTALYESLSIVTRAAATRSTRQILEGVLLAIEGQKLTLTCTDETVIMRTELECTCEADDGERIVLPARLFTEVVRKMPDGQVTLTFDERLQTRVECHSSRTTLQGLQAHDFPALPELQFTQSLSISEKTLRDYIRQTSFALSQDESRPLLAGFLMEQAGGFFNVVALDGIRMAVRSLHTGGEGKLRIVVPGKALIEVGRILGDSEEMIELSFSDSYMGLELGATHVLIRLLDGEYLDYRKVLPAESQTRVLIKKGALEDALDRASLLAREGKNNLVRLSIEEDMLTMTSNGELGEVFEQFPVQLDGKPLEIAFNIRFLSDMLKSVDEQELEFKFITNLTPCIVVPVEEKGDQQFIYLLLPVRMHGA